MADLNDALACIGKLVVFDPDKALVGPAADSGLWLLLAVYSIATAGAVLISRGAPVCRVAQQLGRAPMLLGFCWGGAVGLLVLSVVMAPRGEISPFIYFRF